MKESKLKKRVLYFMIFAKLLILFWIFISYYTGGLSSKEALLAAKLIIPLFAVYLSAMFADFTGANIYVSNQNNKEDKLVTKTFRNLSYIVLFLYFLSIVIVITLPATTSMDIDGMTSLITGIESFFGIYVSGIVFSLFKKQT